MHAFFSYLIKLLFLFCLVFSQRIAAQDKMSVFESIADKQYRKMTITADFDEFRAHKMKEYRQNAILEFSNETGKKETWNIEIEARGKYRRRVCTDMPPIRLIFPKEGLKKGKYKTAHKKYKLVTHCLERKDSEQTVLREYWTYRMYNQLTDQSFQTVLLEIVYRNTADQSEIQQMGFIIENEKELARRIGGKKEERWGLTKDSIQQISYENLLLFQYMIGNTDWEIKMVRNMIMVLSNGNAPLVIPYDFDAAGLVDASYAVPNPNLKQKSIKQRIAMGTFQDEAVLGAACERFIDLYNKTWCFEDCPYLDEDSKKDMDNYLQDFLKLLENERKRNKVFLKKK
ncbi:MAG: hypothetical protein AAF849_10510 [Bacteroidota bacterium]